MIVVYILLLVLLHLAVLAGLLAVVLGLSGNFILLGICLLVAFLGDFQHLSLFEWFALLGLAVLGEVVEAFLGVAAARKFGASRWGMIGTFIGGILGAAAGTAWIPVLGSLVGAFVGFVATNETDSLWVGLIAGGIAGALVSLIMVLFCVRLGMDQIVVGIAIVLAAEGATSLLHTTWFSRSFPRLPAVEDFAIPLLSDIPVLGPSVFSQPLPVYIGLGLVVLISWMLRHTTIGLNLRAAGERPDSLDAAGVSVVRVRTLAERTRIPRDAMSRAIERPRAFARALVRLKRRPAP